MLMLSATWLMPCNAFPYLALAVLMFVMVFDFLHTGRKGTRPASNHKHTKFTSGWVKLVWTRFENLNKNRPKINDRVVLNLETDILQNGLWNFCIQQAALFHYVFRPSSLSLISEESPVLQVRILAMCRVHSSKLWFEYNPVLGHSNKIVCFWSAVNLLLMRACGYYYYYYNIVNNTW